MNFSQALGFGAALIAAGCAADVAGDLSDGDANRVIEALERHGVAAEKLSEPASEGRFRVQVGRADSSTAVALLSREGLPLDRSPRLLEALGDGALIPSRGSDQARLLIGTAGELERTLSSVDGVVSARVHLAVPEKARLEPSQSQKVPTASVLLRFRTAAPPISEVDVRRLVSGAVPGLSPDAVAVVGARIAASPGGTDLARLGPITTTRTSLNWIRAAIGALSVGNIVLISVVFFLWTRGRRERKTLPPGGAQEESA